LDINIIKKVASTARLHLTDEEMAELSKDMENILKHFAEIKNIRTDEEMYYVHDSENPLRKDEKGIPGNAIGIRDQFTKKEGKHLSAPKSIK
jgi:aspartyl/glutamyl-tRNA(Asn/Gln) amidotransferase C subunit